MDNTTPEKETQQQVIKENVFYGLILAFFTLLLHFLFIQKFRVELYTDVTRSLGYYVALNLFNITAGAWILLRLRRQKKLLMFNNAVLRLTGIYAVVGVLFISGIAFHNAVIDPDLVDDYKTELIQTYQANEDLSEEEKEEAIAAIQQQTLTITPLSFIVLYVIWLCFSLLFSLLLGAVFKKEKQK